MIPLIGSNREKHSPYLLYQQAPQQKREKCFSWQPFEFKNGVDGTEEAQNNRTGGLLGPFMWNQLLYIEMVPGSQIDKYLFGTIPTNTMCNLTEVYMSLFFGPPVTVSGPWHKARLKSDLSYERFFLALMRQLNHQRKRTTWGGGNECGKGSVTRPQFWGHLGPPQELSWVASSCLSWQPPNLHKPRKPRIMLLRWKDEGVHEYLPILPSLKPGMSLWLRPEPLFFSGDVKEL